MNDEQKAAFIHGQIALFNCEVAGMIAENENNTVLGGQPSYKQVDFRELAASYESTIGHNAVIGYFTCRS